MADIGDLISASEDAINSAAYELINAFDASNELFIQRVMKAMKDYAVNKRFSKEGNSLADAKNEIDVILRAHLTTDELGDSIQTYVKEIDSIFQNVQEVQFASSGVQIKTNRYSQLINEYKQLTQETLQALDPEVVSSLKSQIINAIVGRATLKDFENTLRGMINGQRDKLGLLTAHAATYSRDLLFGADGIINQEVAQEIQANAWRYVGSLKPGVRHKLKNGKMSKVLYNESRWQCIQWVGMGVILFKDVEHLIRLAFTKGSGMKNGTTASNFAQNRGGWNCKHAVIPIIV